MKLTLQMPKNAVLALGRVVLRVLSRKPIIVPSHVAADRRWHCEICQYNVRGQCEKCGCAIAAKIHLRSEQCPDQPPRWRRL